MCYNIHFALSSLSFTEPQLKLYLEHGGSDMTTLFHAQSSLEEWQTLELPMGRISSIYRLLLEAVSSGSSEEIITADEILFRQCNLPDPCLQVPDGYLQCENGGCYPREAKCDFTDDCGDYTDETSCGKHPWFKDSVYYFLFVVMSKSLMYFLELGTATNNVFLHFNRWLSTEMQLWGQWQLWLDS